MHGGTGANSAGKRSAKRSNVSRAASATASMFGPGSATNIYVDVDADQHATNRNYQYNGDSLGISLGSFLRQKPRNPAPTFHPHCGELK